jgi:DNA-binding response OmpR family regulator
VPPNKKELGEILLAADLISEAQLSEALAAQQKLGERLASILVRKRILTEKFAVTYLGRQLGVPAVDLSKVEVNLSLLDLIPLEMCERRLIFPVRVDGAHLQLAMSDPTDHVLISQIETETGVRLTPTIALEASIKGAISEARRALLRGTRSATAEGPRPPQTEAASDGGPASDAMAVSPVPALPELAHGAIVVESLGGAELKTIGAARKSEGAAEDPLVLVVEPDEVQLKQTRARLQERRLRVITARTGREALAAVRDSLPDVVLMEGHLSDVHGFEVCRQLKGSERFRGIPVVLTSAIQTGWRFAADLRDKFRADDFVEKPFDFADLVRRIELLLNRSAAPADAEKETSVRKHLKDGVIAVKQGKLDEARSALEQGLALDPFNDLIHYYLAMAFAQKDEVMSAIDHYERAIRINPDFYDAIVSLANLYQRQEFRRKAIEMWELALSATKDETVRGRIKEHIIELL